MDGLRGIVARYQIAAFVLLTLVISWAGVLPAQGALIPHGPMFAALIVLAVVSGRRGVSELWRQMTHWRVDWTWYLIAPGILVAAHLTALGTSLALGARIVDTAHLQSLPACLGVVGPLVLLGGQWEEPGWLGYLLPRFQRNFTRSPLAANLAGGLIRVIWHTPLLVYGKIPWYDYIFYSLALQITVTWLYYRTGGSVLVPMIAHLSSNVLFAIMGPLFSGSDHGRYRMLLVITVAAIALGILIATRGELGAQARPASKPVFSPET